MKVNSLDLIEYPVDRKYEYAKDKGKISVRGYKANKKVNIKFSTHEIFLGAIQPMGTK